MKFYNFLNEYDILNTIPSCKLLNLNLIVILKGPSVGVGTVEESLTLGGVFWNFGVERGSPHPDTVHHNRRKETLLRILGNGHE